MRHWRLDVVEVIDVRDHSYNGCVVGGESVLEAVKNVVVGRTVVTPSTEQLCLLGQH